ncbi:hypothetical protein JCM3775_005209 [Rhodotorula graminis]
MDSLLHLERDFYQQGLDSGLPHGHLHGLIEGRELGRDHAWTLWDEIGYIQGTVLLWKQILAVQGPPSSSSRAASTLDSLLALVDAFPTHNDSEAAQGDVDMTAQLSTLRTKYRTACAALGIRPRMAVSSTNGDTAQGQDSLKSMGMSV